MLCITALSVTVPGGAMFVIALITLVTVGLRDLEGSLANYFKAIGHEGQITLIK